MMSSRAASSQGAFGRSVKLPRGCGATNEVFNMEEQEFNTRLDQLIIQAASPSDYKLLSAQQKIVGAMEILIGTTTRSGVEVFFDHRYKYLWSDALIGLELVNAASSSRNYKIVMDEMTADHFENLQNAIVIEDFDVLYDGIRKYIADNPEILEPSLRR